MKKSIKQAAEAAFAAELNRQSVTNNRKGIKPGSTASHCKDADYSVRDYLMAHGVGSTDDIRCRPGSKHDWELYIRKTHIVGETKVGTGALRYAKTEEELSFDLNAIYPDVDYIAYRIKDFFSTERKFSNVPQQTTVSEVEVTAVKEFDETGAVDLGDDDVPLAGFDPAIINGDRDGDIHIPWLVALLVGTTCHHHRRGDLFRYRRADFPCFRAGERGGG